MSRLSIAAYFAFARVKVVAQNVHSEGAWIHLRPDLRGHPLCHECHRPAGGIHSKGYRRVIRDLDLAGRRVWLHLDYRKVWCRHCGKARVEHGDFCDSPRRLTHRLRRHIDELCKRLPVADVARHLGIDPKTVTAIDQEFPREEFGQTDDEGLRRLAIDEIAVKKGHRHMTGVMDYLSGRVVWTGEGHDKETLDGFFAGMPA